MICHLFLSIFIYHTIYQADNWAASIENKCFFMAASIPGYLFMNYKSKQNILSSVRFSGHLSPVQSMSQITDFSSQSQNFFSVLLKEGRRAGAGTAEAPYP